MKIRNRALGALAALLAFFVVADVASAADRPYTEGPVSMVASIRTEPGKFDDYMAWLAGSWHQMMEAQKAAGLILSYAVYQASPRRPDDPDIYLVVTFKDMAALDGLRDKMEPIQEKLQGTLQERNAKTIERGKIRTQLGSELIRQLVLK